jgi:hypothetical protein
MAPTKTKAQQINQPWPMLAYQQGYQHSYQRPNNQPRMIWGFWEVFFVHFPLVPNMFPSSQWVPQHVLHSTSLLSHMLRQMLFSYQQ